MTYSNRFSEKLLRPDICALFLEREQRQTVDSLLLLRIDDVDILFRVASAGVPGQRGGSLDAGTPSHNLGDKGVAGTMEGNVFLDSCVLCPFIEDTESV